MPFEVEEKARYVVKAFLTQSWDYGTWQITLDGRIVVGSVDLYAPAISVRVQKLGIRTLRAGSHTLTFMYLRSNPQSTGRETGGPGRYLGIDRISFRKIPARLVQKVKKRPAGEQ